MLVQYKPPLRRLEDRWLSLGHALCPQTLQQVILILATTVFQLRTALPPSGHRESKLCHAAKLFCASTPCTRQLAPVRPRMPKCMPWTAAGVFLRDKAILLLAHELHPRLDPTCAASRIERVLHEVFHVRVGAAEVGPSGDPDARSSAYLRHLEDRYKRLQGVVGTLIRSQLLSGAHLLVCACVLALPGQVLWTQACWHAMRYGRLHFLSVYIVASDIDLRRVLRHGYHRA